METIKLVAKPRTQLGKKVSEVRKAGFIPAVLYGKDKKPQNLQVEAKKFKEVYAKAGSSALVDIETDGLASRQGGQKTIKVLIQDVQEDPITNKPIHIDFYAIRMDEKITTQIPLNFVGVSPAVKDLEGSLVKNYDEVEVECLPADLVSEIKVDISGLKTFDDIIRMKDLNIPEKIKLLHDAKTVVALVTPPRSEEELEAMETEAAADKEKEVVEGMEKEAQDEKAAKEAEKEGEEGEEKKDDKTGDSDKAGKDKPTEGDKKSDDKK